MLFRPLDPGWEKIRIRDKYPGSYFRELSNIFFGLKILKSFVADPDPGSDAFFTREPGSDAFLTRDTGDGKIPIRDLGSATRLY